MLLLCGGRDSSGMPLADAYGLLMHRNGPWQWTLAPGVSPSPRYQHAAVFVGARLHVTGGAIKGGRAVEGEGAIAVLDTAAGVWLDRNGLVTSRGNKGQTDSDLSLESLHRCRHAAASVGIRIYILGGLKGEFLLDDYLVAENSQSQSDINSQVSPSERDFAIPSPRSNTSNTTSYSPTSPSDGGVEMPSSGGLSMDKKSMDKLTEASAAEAEVANAVWQAAQAASATPEETSVSDSGILLLQVCCEKCVLNRSFKIPLSVSQVVVAKENVGSLGGMVRQLSLDQFENESRRMIPFHNDVSNPTKKFTRRRSPQGLHKKFAQASKLEASHQQKILPGFL